MGTLSGEATLPIFIFTPPLFKLGSTLNGKNCSPQEQFFPLRVDPILEELHNLRREKESHKNVVLCKIWWKKHRGSRHLQSKTEFSFVVAKQPLTIINQSLTMNSNSLRHR